MTPEKLGKIKEYQRDYEKRFNEKLEIDWFTMKNLPKPIPTLDELFKISVQEHGASETLIRGKKRLHSKELKKERAAVSNFCKKVVHYHLDFADAAKHINRDRTLVYYYGFKKV